MRLWRSTPRFSQFYIWVHYPRSQRQVRDYGGRTIAGNYLENENVLDSVNFPRVQLLLRPEMHRIQIVNRNEPRMLSQFASILAGTGHNIDNLVNKGRGVLAYSVIDINGILPGSMLESLKAIDGVIWICTSTSK